MVMNCPNQFRYVIQTGDDLFQLAKHYKTNVPILLLYNPHIDPNNLKVGTPIIICPGKEFQVHEDNENQSACLDVYKRTVLSTSMRLVWEQHVYWTRMLLISIAERLKDQKDVTDRLLQNPNDIADVFRKYYSNDIAELIARLLNEHLQIGAELITALRDGKKEEADRLNKKWFENADKMAMAFSSINPYYKFKEVRQMLYEHLNLTTQEVAMRLAGNYPADIEAFNKVEKEVLSMADYFTSGIIQQFPAEFK